MTVISTESVFTEGRMSSPPRLLRPGLKEGPDPGIPSSHARTDARPPGVTASFFLVPDRVDKHQEEIQKRAVK